TSPAATSRAAIPHMTSCRPSVRGTSGPRAPRPPAPGTDRRPPGQRFGPSCNTVRGGMRSRRAPPGRPGGDGGNINPMTKRCTWAGDDPLMQAYHDDEWGRPQHDPRMLWEMLMLEGFQAGLSWRTILHKRESFRKAFAAFDPRKVARFGDNQVAQLLS